MIHLTNYKAVKSANIELSDLTVLAGINASGKSTIARLFFAGVEGLRNYERYSALASLNSPAAALVDKVMSYFSDARVIAANENIIASIREEVKWTDCDDFEQFINAMITRILSLLSKNRERISEPRVMNMLPLIIDAQILSFEHFYDFIALQLNSVSSFYADCLSGKNQQTVLSEAFRYLGRFGGCSETTRLLFKEGDVPLFSTESPVVKREKLYSLLRAVYLDDPGNTRLQLEKVDSKLRINGNSVYDVRLDQINDDGFKTQFLDDISAMTGGRIVKSSQTDMAFSDWIFSANDESYRISLEESAEGIKSLAPLALLDKCGLLENGTLLIIDEPETHQHPQWIVGYARMLVNLIKRRKIKVLLATHSAYMVRALQREYYKNLKKGQLRFYLAVPDGSKFTYENMGDSVSEIFKVFNVALREVAYYQEDANECVL